MPTSAAILASRPSTLIFTGAVAAFVSPVSIATSEPPIESPTKRMPDGPKASGPADMSGTLPAVNSTAGLAGWRAAVNVSPSAMVKDNATTKLIRGIVRRIWSPCLRLRNLTRYITAGDGRQRAGGKEIPCDQANSSDAQQ